MRKPVAATSTLSSFAWSLVVLLLTTSLLLGQDTEEKKDNPKDKEKKAEKKEEEKEKKEELQIPNLETPLDNRRATQELKNTLDNYRDYLKNRLPLLLKDLENFQSFDKNIRRLSPFISGELLKGVRSQNPSIEERKKVRQFWVNSKKVDPFLALLESINRAKEAVNSVVLKLDRGVSHPALWPLPYHPQLFHILYAIQQSLQELKNSSPPPLLGGIFDRLLESIKGEMNLLESWEKKLLEKQHQALQVSQLKDKKLLASFRQAFPPRELLLVKWKMTSPSDIYENPKNHIYFYSEKDGWVEFDYSPLFLNTWRALSASGSLANEGLTRKLYEESHKKVKANLLKREKLAGLAAPLFPQNLSVTKLILEEKNPGLFKKVKDFEDKGWLQNLELLFAKMVVDEKFRSYISDIHGLYHQYNALALKLYYTSSRPSDLVLKIDGATVETKNPLAIVEARKKEVLVSGTMDGKPLWEQVISNGKKYNFANFWVKPQISREKPKKWSAKEWEGLEEKLKKGLKSAEHTRFETHPGNTPRALVQNFLKTQKLSRPFPARQIPAYQVLLGGKFLVDLPFSQKKALKGAFQKFDSRFKAYSMPYKVPENLLKKVVGQKPRFEDVTSKYDLYWRALTKKEKEKAIELYREISGDENGEKVVSKWLKYTRLIEKYRRQTTREEQIPYDPYFKHKDSHYLQEAKIPLDGTKSKANRPSKYDGNPRADQLAIQPVIPNSIVGKTEGERFVESLIDGQKELNQRKIKELKEFLSRDHGTKNNPGSLRNVWVDKRELVMEIKSTGNTTDNVITVKINGKIVKATPVKKDAKAVELKKVNLKDLTYRIKLPLQVGYNTLQILAHSVPSDYNRGLIRIENVTRGPEKKEFYLNHLEVGTMTIYYPPPELNFK